jgi:hypothetical protein
MCGNIKMKPTGTNYNEALIKIYFILQNDLVFIWSIYSTFHEKKKNGIFQNALVDYDYEYIISMIKMVNRT